LLLGDSEVLEGPPPSVAGRVRHIAEPLPQVVQLAGVVLFQLMFNIRNLYGRLTYGSVRTL